MRESEDKYRTLFDTMGEGLAVYSVIRDEAGRVSDITFDELNLALERQTGYDRRTMLGRRMSERLPPAVAERWLAHYARAADSREPVMVVDYVATLDRWFDVSIYPQPGDQLSIFYRDVTAAKRAEAVLRASEERQRFLLAFSDALRAEPDASAVADCALRMLSEHMTLDRSYIVSYRLQDDRADLVHQVGNETVPPLPDMFILSEYPAAFRATLGHTLVIEDEFERQGLSDAERRNSGKLGMRAMIAATLRRGENKPMWSMVVISSRPRRWTPDEIALVEEVTERTWAAIERARAENALQQAHDSLEQRVRERTSQVQSLFERLVSAQEEERRRIARDIHDQLGQQMTALRMNLDAWRTKANGDAAVHEQADRTQRLAEELDQSIDFLTWQLRPAALDHLGLSAALRNLVADWSERFGIAAEYDGSGDDGVRLSQDVQANLYRIVQEALHNVAKHAHATHVSVSMECRDQEIVVVEDNGRGFAPPPPVDREGTASASSTCVNGPRSPADASTSNPHPETGSAVFVRVPIVVPESA